MEKQPASVEVGIQERSSSLQTSVQEPSALPRVSPTPTAPVETNRELVWFLLGGLTGALFAGVAALLEPDGDWQRDLLLKAIVGSVLGIVGGYKGEQWRAGRFADRLVPFWAVYWLLVWALLPILMFTALYLWVVCKVMIQGMDPPSWTSEEFLALARIVGLYALCGAIFGAVGGAVKQIWRTKTTPTEIR